MDIAIKELAMHVLKGTSPNPSEFSKEDVTETFKAEINKLAGSYNLWRRNKYDIFEIMNKNFKRMLSSSSIDKQKREIYQSSQT